jgi:arginase family enzyme
MTILLIPHSHGAPPGNRLEEAWAPLRDLLPDADVIPAPLLAGGALEEGVRNLRAIAAHARAVAGHLAGVPGPVLHFGADCGGELAVVATLNLWRGGRLRVIWFDAHADLNTPASSPSANFHGMVLRTLLGDGPRSLAALVPLPLAPRQVAFAGLRDTGPAEREYIARHGIAVLDRCDRLEPGDALYIHVDYDVLDGTRYPDSVYPVAGGMDPDRLIADLASLRARHEIAGMSLTEYVPRSADNGTLRRLLRFGFGIAVSPAERG